MKKTVDLEAVNRFVTSKEFTNFLLENTTDFEIAAFILQTLLDVTEGDKTC